MLEKAGGENVSMCFSIKLHQLSFTKLFCYLYQDDLISVPDKIDYKNYTQNFRKKVTKECETEVRNGTRYRNRHMR